MVSLDNRVSKLEATVRQMFGGSRRDRQVHLVMLCDTVALDALRAAAMELDAADVEGYQRPAAPWLADRLEQYKLAGLFELAKQGEFELITERLEALPWPT